MSGMVLVGTGRGALAALNSVRSSRASAAVESIELGVGVGVGVFGGVGVGACAGASPVTTSSVRTVEAPEAVDEVIFRFDVGGSMVLTGSYGKLDGGVAGILRRSARGVGGVAASQGRGAPNDVIVSGLRRRMVAERGGDTMAMWDDGTATVNLRAAVGVGRVDGFWEGWLRGVGGWSPEPSLK